MVLRNIGGITAPVDSSGVLPCEALRAEQRHSKHTNDVNSSSGKAWARLGIIHLSGSFSCSSSAEITSFGFKVAINIHFTLICSRTDSHFHRLLRWLESWFSACRPSCLYPHLRVLCLLIQLKPAS